MISPFAALFAAATQELTLFAASGLLIGGLDDLAVDLIWMTRLLWRRITVYRRFPRATIATLAPPARPGRIAVFIGAWHEGEVIGPMLRAALARLAHADYRVYVGTYPNDPATLAAVGAIDDARVRLVEGRLPGPTTKAEALNRCWAAMLADEADEGIRVKAIALHDAEDVVHPHELAIYDLLIERFDLVQLPVLPLLDPTSRWIAASYADEFAEAHGKQLIVREAIGAGVPAAGTGCALSRRAVARMAEASGGMPFDAASLTEDYELGVRLPSFGGRGAFVRVPVAPGGPPVAVRAYFPATYETAVRQKARWMTGIAFAGWDRLRWQGGWAERWMRLRDRRPIIASVVLVAAYLAMLMTLVSLATGVDPRMPGWMAVLLGANALLLVWRLGMRALLVGRTYGWRQGLLSLPRMVVSNAIQIGAAWRALVGYVPGAPARWDKTAHHFPSELPCD